MVCEYQDERIFCEPGKAVIEDPRKGIWLIPVAGSEHPQYGRPEESHKNCGGCMHAGGVMEKIHGHTQCES